VTRDKVISQRPAKKEKSVAVWLRPVSRRLKKQISDIGWGVIRGSVPSEICLVILVHFSEKGGDCITTLRGGNAHQMINDTHHIPSHA